MNSGSKIRFVCFQTGHVLFIIAISLSSSGCKKGKPIQENYPLLINLEDRLVLTDSARWENLKPQMLVARRGEKRNALVLIAPVAVRASLRGVRGEKILAGFAAPVFNVGDGIKMEIFLVRDGARQKIGSRDFDAARRAEDRFWIPIKFPLKLAENDDLEIEISAGPQGDLVADWLALSSLQLISNEAQ